MANPMFDTPFIASVGWALVHFIWQGTLIGVVTALALLIIAPARLRYAVSCLALTCMLVAPITSVVVDAIAPKPVSSSLSLMSLPADALDVARLRSVDAIRVLPLAVLWWMVGVLMLSIRLVMAAIAATRLAHAAREVEQSVAARARLLAQRLGVAMCVRVAESAAVQSPTVIGWLRPIILLPASALTALPISHLDAVLVHELAHVRRHDFIVNVLQTIVETLLFYHPAVWWCSRQVRIEREHCCDDLVVDICGDRIGYAKALASLEEQRTLRPVLSLNASGGRLVDRIRRLLNPKPMNDARSTAWTTVSVLTLMIVIVAAIPVARFVDVAVSAQGQPSRVPQVPAPPRAPEPPVPAAPLSTPLPPAPPLPPAALAELEAKAHELALGAARVDDELLRSVRERLERLALETGGIYVEAPPPAPPAVPSAPEPPMPPQATPAPPASSAPPTMPAPPVQPAQPAPPAAPAPPAPPQGDLAVPSDQQVDAIRQMADQLSQTAQTLLRQSGELRRAEQQLQLRRMELLAKEKELATLRDRTLEQQIVLQDMHKALAESFAKAEAFRAIEPKAQRLREQVEALRKQIESLRAR